MPGGTKLKNAWYLEKRVRLDRRNFRRPKLMASRFTITSPIPTPEETAKQLGVSPARLRRIIEIADAVSDKTASSKKLPAARGKSAKKRAVKRTARQTPKLLAR